MKLFPGGQIPAWVYGVPLLLIFFFLSLGGYDLSAPDEPRFALVAKEMLEAGHWILPHRNDQPYPDKPPLLFWLIAGFSALINSGEVSALTARLPSALSAAWAVGLLWNWVRRTGGGQLTAHLTAGVLMSSFLFFYEARMAQIDMLLCALTTTAVVLGYHSLTGRPRPLALGCCLGLGILAKGPVGYLVPAGALGLFALFRGQGTWRKYPWQALLWGLLPPLLWLGTLLSVVAAQGQWDYFVNLVIKQTVTRAINPWHHLQPFYYFGVTLLHDFLPWTPFLLLALPWRKTQRRALKDPEKLAWAVVLFTLVFFSLSKGKRNIYILPAFPFAAYLAAGRLTMLFNRGNWSRAEKCAACLPAIAFLLAGIGLLAAARGLLPAAIARNIDTLIHGIPDPPPLSALGLGGAALLICGLVALSGVWRSHGGRFVGGSLVGMAAGVLLVYGALLPWIGPYRSGRHFMEQASAIIAAESRQPVVGMIQYRSAFRLYGAYPIVELASEFGTPRPDLPKVMDFWHDHPQGWVIATEEYWLPTKTLHDIPHAIRLEEQIGPRQPLLLIQLFPPPQKGISSRQPSVEGLPAPPLLG